MLIYLQVIETPADKSKFEELYEEYQGLAYHVAYKKINHVQDAEDVVQHVFMKIAENIKKIEPVSPKTKQLIVTMVENRVIDLFRVRGNHPVVPLTPEMLLLLPIAQYVPAKRAKCSSGGPLLMKKPGRKRELTIKTGRNMQRICKKSRIAERLCNALLDDCGPLMMWYQSGP